MDEELPEHLAAIARSDLDIRRKLSEDPSSIELVEQFAASARATKDHAELAHRYGITLASRPDDKDAYLDYMRALSDCRRFAEALKVAKTGMQRFPEEFLFPAEAAHIALAIPDLDEAITLAEQSWSLKPGHPHSYHAMNRILRDTGRFSELRDFLQSQADHPQFGANARECLHRLREDSAIFFNIGLDQIAASIKRSDWVVADSQIRARISASFVEDIDTVLGDRARYQKLLFLALRLRVFEEIPDADTVHEARRFEAENREALAAMKPWPMEANTIASFYFLLGKAAGCTVKDSRQYFDLALGFDASLFPARLWSVALERGYSPAALFAALGISLPKETWKYRLAAALLNIRPSGQPHWPPEDADCAICIRGICDANTPFAVRYYRHHYPNSRIIVSVWDDTNPAWIAAMEPYADRILLQATPKFGGFRNINMQIANAYGVLSEAEKMGAKTVLLARTDFMIFRPRLIEQLTRLVTEKKGSGTGPGPIVIPDAYTRKWVPRHPSDMIMFGFTEDVLKFWSVTWQIKMPVASPEQEQPPEIYLTRAYLDRCGRFGAQRTEIEWLSALADLFIVKNFSWFEALWLKQPHFRDASGESLWSACLSEAEWETIGLSRDQSHTQYFSSRDFTAFYDQILGLPKF